MASWHNWGNYAMNDLNKISNENKIEKKGEYNPFSVKQLTNENTKLKEENTNLKNELDFYKSLFITRRNSCIFNLKIKKMNGDNVWVDRVRDQREDFLKLDMDDEVEEWLEPVRCER